MAELLLGTQHCDVAQGHRQGDVLGEQVDVIGDDSLAVAENQGLGQCLLSVVVAVEHPNQHI